MKIDSIKDPRIELARELASSAGRKKHGKVLLFGLEQIHWAVNAGLKVEFILHCHPRAGEDPVMPQDFLGSRRSLSSTPIGGGNDNDVPVFTTSEGILKKVTDTNYVVPVVGVVHIPMRKQDNDFVVVFDHVVDFGNIGTIIRTANSFGINTFASTNNQLDPYQRKTIDASRGSVFNSTFRQFETADQTIQFLKKQGYQIVVTSPHAKHLQSQAPLQKKPIALVIGNETDGVCDTMMQAADLTIQIPMQSVESLNVGVFTGISLYELRFKMVLLMLKEKIFDNLGRQVNVTGKMIQMAFDHNIQKISDLSGMQVIFLMILHCDQTMSLAHIGQDMGLFDEDLVQFLQPLRTKNLITEDTQGFHITVQGEQFLAEIWPIVEQINTQILSDFTEQERSQLKNFLTRLQENCSKIQEV